MTTEYKNQKTRRPESPHEGNQFAKILKHSPWYFFNSLLTKAVSFFLLPVYTKYLSPEDYGILANLESFGRILPILFSLYIDSAFVRFYYREREISLENVQRLYSTHFWFVIFWGGALSFITAQIAPSVLNNIVEVPFLPVAAVVLTQLLAQLATMTTSIWQANLQARKIVSLNIVLSLSGIIIAVILLIPMNMGWTSKIYAATVVALIRGAYLVLIAVKNNWLKFSFERQVLFRSLLFSLPLAPNFAAGWISGYSDRLILGYYGRLDEAGLYSVAHQFAFLLYVFSNAISMVQTPIVMSTLTNDRPAINKKIVEFLSTFFWTICFLYIGLSLVSKDVLVWFVDERFHESYKLIPVLAFIYVLGGIYRVFTTVVSFHNKMWIISSAALLQVFINILLNISFIPMFGMYAAAWATLLSLFVYTVWIIFWAIKLESLEIPWGSLLIIATIVLFIVMTGYVLDRTTQSNWSVVLLKILLLIVFVIPVYKMKSLYIVRLGIKRLNLFRRKC